jgi:hypothetical protein
LPTVASSSLVWESDVSSSGTQVTSSVLTNGVLYRVVATEVWLYQDEHDNLAADAMYYTTDYSNTVFWGNYFAAPGGHSFLQIDGQDVNWGPFRNGDSGNHVYTIYYAGVGAGLAFNITDWVDGNIANNFGSMHVQIYRDVIVGGHIVDPVPDGLVAGFAVGAIVLAALAVVPVVSRRGKVNGA